MFSIFFFLSIYIPIHEYTTQQRLDHFNESNQETFTQRYFVLDEYGRKGKSQGIIFDIGSESAFDPNQLFYFDDISRKYGLIVVGLEHRYFGTSYPGNHDRYKEYLTVEQSIEDFATMVQKMKQDYCEDLNKCTVLLFGGSYSGTLAHFMKIKYPSIADYVWTSSPVVWARTDNKCVDKRIRDILDEISLECGKRARSTMLYLEDLAFNPNTAEATMSKFHMSGALPESFLTGVGLNVENAIQNPLSFHYVQSMCEYLEDAKTNDEMVDAMARFSNEYKGLPRTAAADSNQEEPSNWDSFMYDYILCNQLGWDQTSGGYFHSSKANRTLFDLNCKLQYNVTYTKIDELNSEFNALNPNSTNIVMVHGWRDPLQCISEDLPSDPSINRTVYLVHDTHHCQDWTQNMENTKSKDMQRVKDEIFTLFAENLHWEVRQYFDWRLFAICFSVAIIVLIIIGVVVGILIWRHKKKKQREAESDETNYEVALV